MKKRYFLLFLVFTILNISSASEDTKKGTSSVPQRLIQRRRQQHDKRNQSSKSTGNMSGIGSSCLLFSRCVVGSGWDSVLSRCISSKSYSKLKKPDNVKSGKRPSTPAVSTLFRRRSKVSPYAEYISKQVSPFSSVASPAEKTPLSSQGDSIHVSVTHSDPGKQGAETLKNKIDEQKTEVKSPWWHWCCCFS